MCSATRAGRNNTTPLEIDTDNILSKSNFQTSLNTPFELRVRESTEPPVDITCYQPHNTEDIENDIIKVLMEKVSWFT